MPEFSCSYAGCTFITKSPGGLSQHRNACSLNPRNRYRFSPMHQTPPPNFMHAQEFEQGPEDNELSNFNDEDIEVNESPLTSWARVGTSELYIQSHSFIDGAHCDEDGYELDLDVPPTQPDIEDNPAYPFNSVDEFKVADFLFQKTQMSAGDTNTLMDLWANYNAMKAAENNSEPIPPPFNNTNDLFEQIDSIPWGDVPWEAFSVSYSGEKPEKPSSWMDKEYEVWFRDPLKVLEGQLANPDFANEIDWAPKQLRDRDGKRHFTDFMSGNWAWNQANELAENDEHHGAMFAPVILGSDKTTVSVATGQNEYYPLYASLGNIQNHVCRAHRNAVAVIGFLAIPKTDREHDDSVAFRKFRCQLFHISLERILSSLKPWMKKAKVTMCADGYYRRVIWGLGPYIADYPEQCLLASVVSGWCAKCIAFPDNLDNAQHTSVLRSHEHTESIWDATDGNLRAMWDGYRIIGEVKPFTVEFERTNIHELLALDLLHQIIKGTFKDHLVDWVLLYLKNTHQDNPEELKRVLAELDRRIMTTSPFPGLRHFREGRKFKQWTGDDSKALMKVFLPAINGLVPEKMVHAFSAFLEFCYLVRRSDITEDMLIAIDAAVERFHFARQIFVETGTREHVSLPRQHSMVHYHYLIEQFGAPNGLCSSITESKHIKAVKMPWRRSNRNEALGQMLLTNQRIDKLNALRSHLESKGLLLSLRTHQVQAVASQLDKDDTGSDGEDDEGVRSIGDVRLPERAASHYPGTVELVGEHIHQPDFRDHIRRFLYDQLYPNAEEMGMEVNINTCPEVKGNLKIRVFHSATCLFHAPSDLSGIGGMRREIIRATPKWRGGFMRHDCVFVVSNPDLAGFHGLQVAQVQLFFSFRLNGRLYECALVRWYECIGDTPCESTGLWAVQPHYVGNVPQHRRLISVIHIDTILRLAHLIGIASSNHIPQDLKAKQSLETFVSFYVNKYADHTAHELAF